MKMLLKDGKYKVLTLSYDDGTVEDQRLLEIFNRHGLKATFNINSGLYCNADQNPSTGRMTKKSSVDLYKNSGHEIAVHGRMHQWPTKISSVQLIHELLADRQSHEDEYGEITRGMAYAFGDYDQNVIAIARQCGIVYARTTKSTHTLNFPENWLELHPTCHHNDPKLMEIAERFVYGSDKYKQPRMFYVWGHSFEFPRNDNWNVIEEFAQYVSGHEHIWYATNIEIYDYVTAYQQLQASADETLVHNPSAIDVWAEIKGDVYCIPAGKTLNLK